MEPKKYCQLKDLFVSLCKVGDNPTAAIFLKEAETISFHAKPAEEKQSSRRFFLRRCAKSAGNLLEILFRFAPALKGVGKVVVRLCEGGDNPIAAMSLKEAETVLFHAKSKEQKQSSRRFFCVDLRNLRETYWRFFTSLRFVQNDKTLF